MVFIKLYKERIFEKIKPITLILIIVLILLFSFIIFKNVRVSTIVERQNITQKAIERAVVNCYAIEGKYPQDIKYIEQNYGVIIDHKRFIVEYEIIGSNVLPYVKVIEKGTGG